MKIMSDIQTCRKRLLYQSQHRGMREMDLVLGGYAQQNIPLMNEEELEEFEDLLALPDQEIYGWIFEGVPLSENSPEQLIMNIKAFANK